MHNNFYFLRQLSKTLSEKISGYSVVSCFSQNKDELIVELNNSVDSFFIKATLSPTFCCLSFPDEFHRARKNSVDLFDIIILKKVIRVRQFENERAFAIELEGGFLLIFKMQGNFGNVLVSRENRVEEIFKNQLTGDFEIKIEELDKSIDFGKDNFLENIDQLHSVYFTFGKRVFDYLKTKNFDGIDPEEKWKLFVDTVRLLEEPSYYVAQADGLIFSLLPIEKTIEVFNSPVPAINFFANNAIRDQNYTSEKREALMNLQTRLKNAEAYMIKGRAKLVSLEQDHHYQLWADLIMANLHLIKQGQEKISLNSFYDGVPVEIKLKRELNAQKNAEVFYRKSKNHQLEIDKLKEAIAQKEKVTRNLEELIFEIGNLTDVRSLRNLMAKSGYAKKSAEISEPLPYREFEYKNFKIWVGKNAEANDKLTLKYSYKEDLWLHAKDVAGSHVLVKYQSGKSFPKDVIEYAAGLAAFYSKRKTESLCPVAVTPKKFVRKRKGDPAGAVVVEREEVILVEPFESKN